MSGQDLDRFVLKALTEAACHAIEAHDCDPISGFSVLCRIDAYADYVAVVDADDPESAAWLARENHVDYAWRSDGVQQFDARLYVTLDAHGAEIEESRIGDF